jgi:hypothetical protein
MQFPAQEILFLYDNIIIIKIIIIIIIIIIYKRIADKKIDKKQLRRYSYLLNPETIVYDVAIDF